MVLIELGQGDDLCNRTIIKRLGQIDQPETLEIAELKLIIQITKRYLASKKDHPEEVEPLKNDFLAMMNSPASNVGRDEESELSQRNVALTVFLLSVQHEELIPEGWYAPHPDQQQRTQIIAQLHEWMSPEELLDIYVLHAEAHCRDAAQSLDSSAGTPVSKHLLAMLSLAMASAPENYLSNVASLLSLSGAPSTQGSNDKLPTLDGPHVSTEAETESHSYEEASPVKITVLVCLFNSPELCQNSDYKTASGSPQPGRLTCVSRSRVQGSRHRFGEEACGNEFDRHTCCQQSTL
jgi:hypothetical protein